MKKPILTATGLTIIHVNNRIHVKSKKLDLNPIFNVPFGVKIQSGYIPQIRQTINQWFTNKFHTL